MYPWWMQKKRYDYSNQFNSSSAPGEISLSDSVTLLDSKESTYKNTTDLHVFSVDQGRCPRRFKPEHKTKSIFKPEDHKGLPKVLKGSKCVKDAANVEDELGKKDCYKIINLNISMDSSNNIKHHSSEEHKSVEVKRKSKIVPNKGNTDETIATELNPFYRHCVATSISTKSMKLPNGKSHLTKHSKSEKLFSLIRSQAPSQKSIPYTNSSSSLYHPVPDSVSQLLPWRLYDHEAAATFPPLSETTKDCILIPSFSLSAQSLNIIKCPTTKTTNRKSDRKVAIPMDKLKKDDVLGYLNPLVDGPPKYQKRLAQLAAFVSDTIRNERSRTKCKNIFS